MVLEQQQKAYILDIKWIYVLNIQYLHPQKWSWDLDSEAQYQILSITLTSYFMRTCKLR